MFFHEGDNRQRQVVKHVVGDFGASVMGVTPRVSPEFSLLVNIRTDPLDETRLGIQQTKGGFFHFVNDGKCPIDSNFGMCCMGIRQSFVAQSAKSSLKL